MEKINFKNYPSTDIPLNAESLKQMQDNIENAIEQRITTGEECAINEWIDGKQVYRKRINCGALPDTAMKNIEHELSNVKFIRIEGMIYESEYSYPMPYVAVGNLGETATNSIGITVTPVAIIIATNRTVAATAVVDLYYTKNS